MNELSISKELPPLSSPDANIQAPQISEPDSFGTILARSLDEVNELHADADAAVQDFAAGRQRDIHQTMIALEKADVAFQLLMQVRNKIVSAYETIMRMSA